MTDLWTSFEVVMRGWQEGKLTQAEMVAALRRLVPEYAQVGEVDLFLRALDGTSKDTNPTKDKDTKSPGDSRETGELGLSDGG